MSKRPKWRGYAEFVMPDGIRRAMMTVCPGNPKQEGQRFRVTLEAAAAKLDHLYIIEAGELGFHNLKRLVPKNEARAFAIYRGQNWQAAHRPYIEEFMPGRCEILTYNDIIQSTNHSERVAIIRDIYERGHNAVSDWFNDSINADLDRRTERKAKDGVFIESWAMRESALDYLCDEYAMRSIMWERFGLPEIYIDRAVYEPGLFQAQNSIRLDIDLTIPPVCPIKLVEVDMVHDRHFGKAKPVNDVHLPDHATLPERVAPQKLGKFGK